MRGPWSQEGRLLCGSCEPRSPQVLQLATGDDHVSRGRGMGDCSTGRQRSQLILASQSLQSLGRSNRWLEALKLYHQLGVKGLEHDLTILNILLKAICNNGHWREALLVKDDKVGVSSDTFTWNTLLQGCTRTRSWLFALGILADLRMRSDALIDEVSFNTAIACMQGRWRCASSLLAKMSHEQLRTDVVGHSAVAAVLSNCEAVEKVLWPRALLQLQT